MRRALHATTLIALLASLLVLPGAASAATVDAQARAERFDAVRQLSADDTVAAAIAWSLVTFPDGGAGEVLLGRADIFPDSLSAGQAQADRPLLLTGQDRLDLRVQNELRRLGARHVTVVGNEAAVPAHIVEALELLGYTHSRYGGPTRVETAVELASAMHPDATEVVLTRAWGEDSAAWADSLAAGAAAATMRVPLLLTGTDRLHPAVAAWLDAHPAVGTVHIAGGPVAVSEDVERELVGRGLTVRREAGDTRHSTAVALTGMAGHTDSADAGTAVLLDAEHPQAWAEGFAAAAFAAARGAGVVTTTQQGGLGAPPEPTSAWLEAGGELLVCGPRVIDCDVPGADDPLPGPSGETDTPGEPAGEPTPEPNEPPAGGGVPIGGGGGGGGGAPPPADLTVTVLDDLASTPVEGAEVAISRRNPGGSVYTLLGYHLTDAAGQVSMTGVEPGEFNISWTDDPSIAAHAPYNDSPGNPSFVAPVTIAAGDDTAVELRLTRNGQIDATVLDSVYRTAINAADVTADGPRIDQTGRTGPAGTATISGVYADDYTVTAVATDTVAYPDPSAASTVTVTQGATSTTELLLDPADAALVVTTTDSVSGDPVTGATISTTVTTPSGDQTTSASTENPAGTYTSTGLTWGDHDITISAAGYGTATITALALPPGQTTTANVALDPLDGTIRVEVLDGYDSTPIAGTSTVLIGPNFPADPADDTSTVATGGIHQFPGLDAYSVWDLVSSSPEHSSISTYDVSVPRDGTETVTVTLPPLDAGVRVDVVDGYDNSRLSGVAVALLDPATAAVLDTDTTDDVAAAGAAGYDVRMTSDGRPTPDLAVRVTAPAGFAAQADTPVTATRGTNTDVIVTLTPVAAAANVTVVDDTTGDPIDAATVVMTATSAAADVDTGTTNAAGQVTVTSDARPTEDWTFTASAAGYTDNSAAVAIARGGTITIEIRLTPDAGGGIPGPTPGQHTFTIEVRDSATNDLLPGMTVEAYDDSDFDLHLPTETATGGVWTLTTNDFDLFYFFSGDPAGVYAGGFETDTAVDGGVSTVTLLMDPPPSCDQLAQTTITQGVCGLVSPADGSEITLTDTDTNTVVGTVTTGPDGFFEFTAPAGNYRLSGVNGASTGSQTFTIPDGGTVRQDLTLVGFG